MKPRRLQLKRSKFSDSQIIGILNEVAGGAAVIEVCRTHNISPCTYYHWKANYGGLAVSDLHRLRELEDENRRLKQMYAELSLDHQILKDLPAKKP